MKRKIRTLLAIMALVLCRRFSAQAAPVETPVQSSSLPVQSSESITESISIQEQSESSEIPPVESINPPLGETESLPVQDASSDSLPSSEDVQQEDRPTVIENVNALGEPFGSLNIDAMTEEQKQMFQEYIFSQSSQLEQRQFITFTSVDGTEYYLIIDHGQAGNNVKLLKEVTDQEVAKLGRQDQNIEQIIPSQDRPSTPEPEPKSNLKPTKSIFLIVGGVIVVVVVIVLAKKKKSADEY